MSKNRKAKAAVVERLRDDLQRSQAVVLADYRGLNVPEDTELRRKLREMGVEYRVVKNTLLRRAAAEIGLEGLEPYLEGPTAIAFGFDDVVAPAKALNDFAKTHEALELKAGLLEGRVISVEEVKRLATLPPREELLAKVLAGLQAPLAGMVNVLAAPLRGLVTATDQLRQQREAS